MLVNLTASLKAPLEDATAVLVSDDIGAHLAFKPTVSFDEAENVAQVVIAFAVTVSKSEASSEVLRIEPTFRLDYQLDSPPPVSDRDRLLKSFARVNAIHNAWPYVREIVQNMVGRMALPPLVLPLFKVQVAPGAQAEQSKPAASTE